MRHCSGGRFGKNGDTLPVVVVVFFTGKKLLHQYFDMTYIESPCKKNGQD